MPPDGSDIVDSEVATCLRVLAAASSGALPPEQAERVDRAVAQAHRAVKKRLKAGRDAATRAHDRDLLAAARRYASEIPPLVAEPAGGESPGRLRRARRCYVCKGPYREVDRDYHLLCPDCARFNAERRVARGDLRGRRAVVTGGRIKIGFHTALKLLRDGAEVLVTTRFPRDAARRYAAVPDFDDWAGRLHVHGADFLDLASVVGLVGAVGRRWDGLDILVNNAAQTLYRPEAYHREVRAAELRPLTGPAARLALPAAPSTVDTPAVAWDAFFPAGARDETGQPLDLRPVNSWVLRDGDVTPREWLQVHVVNAFVPFLLTSRLRPLLAAAARPDRYVVQVSAMEASYARDHKTPRHPHTNMAKAALNMLTRTIAEDYRRDGISVTSVDTGWVTDERPHPGKHAAREAGFRPPLDVVDGAARVYDPVLRGLAGEPVYGQFLKDYRSAPW